MRRALILLAAAALAGCGGEHKSSPTASERLPTSALPTSAPSLGPGARHRPPSLSARAARALPIRGMRCHGHPRALYGVHLELFAAGRVVLVPPGIGIAPPRTRDGAYVRGGLCSYPLRTREPTGLVEVAERNRTLGDLFAVWGQPLSSTRMAGFHGRVRAYVGGRRRRAPLAAIPLRRHAQIVLEVGPYIAPHRRYGFPSGL